MANGCPRCCACTYLNFPLSCAECEDSGRDHLHGGWHARERESLAELTLYDEITDEEIEEAAEETSDEVVVRSPTKNEVEACGRAGECLGEDEIVKLTSEEREVIAGEVPEEVGQLTAEEELEPMPPPEYYVDFGKKVRCRPFWDALQAVRNLDYRALV